MIIEKNLQEKLVQLSQSPLGFALIAYLEQAKKEMNDISTIQSFEELQGRKFAQKVIDDLFYFMGEKKTEIKNKNQYT